MCYLAAQLQVAPSTINRLIKGKSSISPDMAHRLSVTLGRTAHGWLTMQAQYDLWVTKKPRLKKIDFSQFDDAV